MTLGRTHNPFCLQCSSQGAGGPWPVLLPAQQRSGHARLEEAETCQETSSTCLGLELSTEANPTYGSWVWCKSGMSWKSGGCRQSHIKEWLVHMFPLSFFCVLKGFSQETWWGLFTLRAGICGSQFSVGCTCASTEQCTFPAELFLGSWLQHNYSVVLMSVSNGCYIIVEWKVYSFWGRHRVLFVCTESHRHVKKEEINLSSSKTCNFTVEEQTEFGFIYSSAVPSSSQNSFQICLCLI